MVDKPNSSNSLAKQELDKAEKQFQSFEKQCNDLTLDRMNTAPKQEVEQQTKISQADLNKSKDIYLKPARSQSCVDKFNENYRSDYNQAMEYVNFIAENKEVIGETIKMWTKPFAGVPAQYWEIPANKPIWAPRHVAEQLSRCKYHRLIMQNTATNSDGMGQYYGSMAVDTTINRLDAIPVSAKRSVFMGASGF